ncbi:MAG: hypothetical protein WC466_02400 [Candidatus Izemoplasmatales bacterium]|jgi:hypothetical protein
MITFTDSQVKIPGCDHIFVLMQIREYFEVREIDDELVYMIAGSELPGLES